MHSLTEAKTNLRWTFALKEISIFVGYFVIAIFLITTFFVILPIAQSAFSEAYLNADTATDRFVLSWSGFLYFFVGLALCLYPAYLAFWRLYKSMIKGGDAYLHGPGSGPGEIGESQYFRKE